jgi:hypothetical protein
MLSVARLLLAALLSVGSAACVAGTPPGPARRPIDPKLAVVVRQALRDRIVAGDIPDIGLNRDRRSILVRRESRDSAELTPDALPRLPGVKLSLIRVREAEARATWTGRPVPFITVGGPEMRGDTAELSLGVDVAEPRRTGARVCCCSRQLRYVRAGGEWHFAAWGVGMCA